MATLHTSEADGVGPCGEEMVADSTVLVQTKLQDSGATESSIQNAKERITGVKADQD